MRIDSNIVSSEMLSHKTELATMQKASNEKADSVKEHKSKENQSSFPGEQKLIEAIEKSNPDVKLENSHLKFSIHEETKAIMIKIVDDETNEVIKEIPSEKILDMVADIIERFGLFVDKRG